MRPGSPSAVGPYSNSLALERAWPLAVGRSLSKAIVHDQLVQAQELNEPLLGSGRQIVALIDCLW